MRYLLDVEEWGLKEVKFGLDAWSSIAMQPPYAANMSVNETRRAGNVGGSSRLAAGTGGSDWRP